LKSRKIWEVTKYATITGAAFGVMAVNISKTKWDALSQANKDALLKAGKEVFEWSVGISAARDKEALDYIVEHGIKAHVLSAEEKEAWGKSFKPAYDAWLKRANDSEKKLLEWVKAQG
jgi:TRAP-type C4-dicarboxylate transport system substrate-binding protein